MKTDKKYYLFARLVAALMGLLDIKGPAERVPMPRPIQWDIPGMLGNVHGSRCLPGTGWFFSPCAAFRAPDKAHIFISIMPISSPNPKFDH